MRYFEDLQAGDVALGPAFVVEREEMVEFARRWDPQPFHLDDAVANQMFGEGGVTAPGVFVMAIRTRLLHDTPDLAVIAGLGYDELRFHESAQVRANVCKAAPEAHRFDLSCALVEAAVVDGVGEVAE